MIQQISNQIHDNRQANTEDIQAPNLQNSTSTMNHFEWSRILENISVVALQKFTSFTIGILSDKQIITLNVRTLQIEQKIKPVKKATCIAIMNSQHKYSNLKSTQSSRSRETKKGGKSVQFFTGSFDGTITMWVIQNNKVRQMKVFSDPNPENRRPVSCLNVMSYHHHQFNNNQSSNTNDNSIRSKTQVSQTSLLTSPKVIIQYILLSGHQNGNVKQWNIHTGQCLKEIETKHNGILFCMATVESDTLLTGGYSNIQAHALQRTNSLPSFSTSTQQTSFSTYQNSFSTQQNSSSSQNSKCNPFETPYEMRSRGFSQENMGYPSFFSNMRQHMNERKNNESHIAKNCQSERGTQQPCKKEFKVIHPGYPGYHGYHCQPLIQAQQDETVVRNMISFEDKSIFSHGFSKDLTEWKLNEKSITKKTHSGHTDSVKCIEKLNESQFITGGRDSNVIVWNKTTNQKDIYQGAHSQPVSSLSAMDENSFVSSGEDNKVLFWKQSQ